MNQLSVIISKIQFIFSRLY